MRKRLARSILLLGLLAADAAWAAPPDAPAIGYDWMDAPDPAGGADPDPWPRADATDTGLDDMIRAERRPLAGVIGEGATHPESGDQRIFHTLRKVGGDYVVVPLFTLHLDRAAGR